LKILGDGGDKSYIYVEDVIAAVLTAMRDAAEFQTYNVRRAITLR